jgi:hypothetical protein
MFRWLRKKIDNFNEVVTEGNYRLPPKSWGELITGIKPKLQLPATSEVAIGTTMIDTSKNLGERFFWGFGVAALGGLVALKWAALIFGTVGIGVYTLEYFQAKKSRNDVITEINYAGQKVKGTRADLYRLHRAQNMIMNITGNLGDSTMIDATHKVLESVKAERGRVEVLEGGRYKASKDAYSFTEPDFRLLVDDLPEFEDKSAIKIDGISLRKGWDGKAATPDDIINHLAALEESLPPEMREKLNQRLKREQPAAVKPAVEAPVVKPPVVEVPAAKPAAAAPT